MTMPVLVIAYFAFIFAAMFLLACVCPWLAWQEIEQDIKNIVARLCVWLSKRLAPEKNGLAAAYDRLVRRCR